MTTNAPITFAIVGCGSIGKRHIAVLDADSQANLVAICDTDAEALNAQGVELANQKGQSDGELTALTTQIQTLENELGPAAETVVKLSDTMDTLGQKLDTMGGGCF